MTSAIALYLFPYVMSAAISAGVAVFVWRRRLLPGATAFMIFTFSQAWWTVGYIFELLSPSLEKKIFWDNVQFLPTFLIPVFVFVFVHIYIGLNRISRDVWVRLIAVPLVSLVLVLTDGRYHLVRINVALHMGTPFSTLTYEYGPAMLGMAVYIYGVVFIAISLLLRHFLEQNLFYRWQIGFIILGMIIPPIGNLLFLIVPGLPRDITPFTFAISNILIAWALFQFRLFDVIPVAYQTVVHSMHDPVVVLDATNRIVALNPAAEHLLSVSQAQVIGMQPDQVLTGWAEVLWQPPHNTGMREITFSRDEELVYIEVTHLPLRSRSAWLVGQLIVMRDITRHKQTEQALMDSEARYRAIVESALQGMLMMQDDKVVFANPALSMILGYQSDEFLAMTSSDVLSCLHDEDSQYLLTEYERTVPIQAHHEVRAVRKNGEPCYLELFITTIDYRGRQAFCATFVDITERKVAEEALRYSEERNRALLAAMPDTILLLDQDGQIVDYHTHEWVTQCPQGSLLGKKITSILPEYISAQIDKCIYAVLATGELQRMSYELLVDQAVQYYEARFVSYGGNCILMLVRHVTASRTAEQQRVALAVEQEKVTLLTRFIQDAAHEFRTPLTIIATNAYLLSHVHDEVRRVQKYEQIQHSVNDLASLLDVMLEMLDVEYTSQLVLKPTDVNTAVSEAITDMTRRIQEKSQTLTLRLQENLPLVPADDDRLSRVFFHVLRNAVQFTAAAGQITIETCYEGDMVVTIIRDTGMGMAPAEQAQIFQRFYRTDKAQTSRGFGLGLSIAQKIITLHNGSIQVSSEPDVGSTFRICLPVLPTADAIA